jgi:hypothetical protein
MVFTIRRTDGYRHTIIAVTGTVDAAATALLREAELLSAR